MSKPIAKSRVAKWSYAWEDFVLLDKRLYVCPAGIRKLFHLPKTARTIQFIAYAHPGKNRVKIKKRNNPELPFNRFKFKVEGLKYGTYLFNQLAKDIVTALGNREAIYVELEYE